MQPPTAAATLLDTLWAKRRAKVWLNESNLFNESAIVQALTLSGAADHQYLDWLALNCRAYLLSQRSDNPWPATNGAPTAVILGLHGYGDYRNAWEEPAAIWAQAGITTYAYDQRGFGAAPEFAPKFPSAFELLFLLAAAALALAQPALLSSANQLAIWGFAASVFATVSHRMIPFFTSGVLPMIEVWRPFWVLWLMLGAVGLEVASVWLLVAGWGEGTAWRLLRGALELGLGGVLVWLAWVWGLVQSLKVRLLAMLHVGFVWFGLSLLLSGASQWLLAAGGVPTLGLGALHALTMGCLGSLMLAMVTRVACGHGGRALVADRLSWSAFLLLQLATLLRIAAAVAPPAGVGGLTAATAGLWLLAVGPWGLRLLRWYGQPRPDGRPG